MDPIALEEAGKAVAARTSIRRWEDEAPADRERYVRNAKTAVATYLAKFSGSSAAVIAKMREHIGTCPTREIGDLLATLADNYEADVINLATQLDAEKQENERLRAIVDGRFADASKLRLKSAAPGPDGSFDLNVQGEIIPLIASHLAEEFKALGGDNYVQMQFSAPETGPLVLTVQRLFGKLPAQVASEAVKRAEAADARLASVMNVVSAAVELEKAYNGNEIIRANATRIPVWKALDEAIRSLPADIEDFMASFPSNVAELLGNLQAWVESFNDKYLMTCSIQHITEVNGYNPAADMEKAVTAIRSLQTELVRFTAERNACALVADSKREQAAAYEDRLADVTPVLKAAIAFTQATDEFAKDHATSQENREALLMTVKASETLQEAVAGLPPETVEFLKENGIVIPDGPTRMARLKAVAAAARDFERDIQKCDPKHLEFWDCFNAYIGEGGDLTTAVASLFPSIGEQQ